MPRAGRKAGAECAAGATSGGADFSSEIVDRARALASSLLSQPLGDGVPAAPGTVESDFSSGAILAGRFPAFAVAVGANSAIDAAARNRGCGAREWRGVLRVPRKHHTPRAVEPSRRRLLLAGRISSGDRGARTATGTGGVAAVAIHQAREGGRVAGSGEPSSAGGAEARSSVALFARMEFGDAHPTVDGGGSDAPGPWTGADSGGRPGSRGRSGVDDPLHNRIEPGCGGGATGGNFRYVASPCPNRAAGRRGGTATVVGRIRSPDGKD